MESITMGINLTNSLEEVDPQELDHVGPGVIRSYECVFCRRGFTTAQALGGHMNIHRKDRAKINKPSYYLSNNMNSNKQEDHSFYANPKFHHLFSPSCPQTYISNTPNNQEGNNLPYAAYLSSMSSISQPVNHENNHQDCHGVMIKSPSREENMSLRLQFGSSHGEDNIRESKRRTRERSNEDELDLELRLGHDPRSSCIG